MPIRALRAFAGPPVRQPALRAAIDGLSWECCRDIASKLKENCLSAVFFLSSS
jgi:hypothetical protein